MRHSITFCLLLFTGFCLLASAGCISSKTSDAIGNVLVAKIFEPQFQLTASTMAFQRKSGRWPVDYAELQSFAGSEMGMSLMNYDRVDFTQNTDGGLAILAVGSGITNRMTLSAPKEAQK